MTATPGPPPEVKRPTDGEMYVWLTGNIDWLERTEELLRVSFPQGATVEQRTAFEVAMHRFGPQMASLHRLRNLYRVIDSDDLTGGAANG